MNFKEKFIELEKKINNNITDIDSKIAKIKQKNKIYTGQDDDLEKLKNIIIDLKSQNFILEGSNKNLINKFTNLKIQIAEIKNNITNYITNIKSLINNNERN